MRKLPTGMNRLNPSGFTLIELMFVAFLFMLMAGLSASMFRKSYDAYAQRTAVNDLVRLMDYARQRAILEHRQYGIHLAPEQESYWLVRQSDDPGTLSLDRISGTWGITRRLPENTHLNDGAFSVLFYPDGTSSACSIHLAFQDHRISLVMDPVMGKGIVHDDF